LKSSLQKLKLIKKGDLTMILDSTSLGKTLDNINEKILYGELITQEEGLEAAHWIASRQGEKGHYRYLFAPTSSDFEQGMKLFTGEKLLCASARHVMGQEAARAAWLLGSRDSTVRAAYDRATSWMQANPGFLESGMYCCGRCSLAFWRHFWIGNFENKEASMIKGLQSMKDYRIGDGKWHRFPFFYAVYTLLDLDLEPAREELKYAQPVIERYLKSSRSGAYSKRKVAILQKALANLN
jgi:hypothetical protein